MKNVKEYGTYKIEDEPPLQNSKEVCEHIYSHGRNATEGDGIAGKNYWLDEWCVHISLYRTLPPKWK